MKSYRGAFGAALAALWMAGCGGGSGTAMSNGGSTPGTVGTAPPSSADLRVTVTAAADRVLQGGAATYTVTVSNVGPDASRDVTINTTLGDTQTLGTATCAGTGGAQCPALVGLSMTVASLPKDGSLTITLPAVVAETAADRALTVTTTVQAPGDPQSANNMAAVTVTAVARNFITLQSDSGDYIGGGLSYSYRQDNARITLSANGGLLNVAVLGDQNWAGDFQLPLNLTRWQQGTFSGLTRYPFHTPSVGGLSWWGEGRGCNTLTGSFTVTQARYEANVLDAIDLSFEQRCEGGSAALRGQIHWSRLDNTQPPGPTVPPPSGLWSPPAGATPASGNFVYLQSDPGDYIGGGAVFSYTPTTSPLIVSASGGLLTVAVADWSGHFQAMGSIAQLQPGYYGNLRRYPFHNPAKGGLSWSGQGRGCNTVQGWFVIDEVAYDSAGLSSVSLRFQQQCEGAAAALRGAMRWSR